MWPGRQAVCVTIPDGVASIGKSAFGCCISLTSLTIPDSVACIEAGAFNGCGILSSVTIGVGVTNVGMAAFAFCPDLMDICFKGKPPCISDDVFEGDGKATVYHLPGTTGWGETFGGRPTAVWNQEPEKPR